MKINAHRAARTRPMTQVGITPVEAVLTASDMELDCTIEPIKPRARMIATAKNPARNLPKPPLKARLI